MARLKADTPFIHPGCKIVDSQFGAYVEIGEGSRISNSSFGDYSYTDQQADIANADVGKFCNIAARTRIGPADHPMDRASQHHMLYRSDDYWDDAPVWGEFFEQRAARRVILGADCWIGAHAIIKPGINVGTGAIVASGAVVTHDVAPYMIVAGVPAKPLRERFPPKLAKALANLAWWDWSHEKLRDCLPDFRALGAKEFVKKYQAQ